MKGSKAVAKKPPPFIPRLDLSGTVAGARPRTAPGLGPGVETSPLLSQLQQKPSQPKCDQFENPSRRTSRRTDSARLISLTDADDHFGSSNDSARMMLSRIKRRAKGASCGGEAGGSTSEVDATSGVDNDNNVVKKPPEEEVVQGALVIADDLRFEPSILEIVEPAATMQSVPESGSMEITCKDEALQNPVHELRRPRSPPISKITPVLELPLPCDAACVTEDTPLKAEENADGSSVNLQASRQERRIEILLWPTGEKLSTLRTLNNTMFLWEDKTATCGSVTSTISDESGDLVLSSLTAAKESQRRLFDTLNRVQGVPRRAICCSAVRELVRAYPPERLVPTSFINDHFVAKFLQQTVCIADHVNTTTLEGIARYCSSHTRLTTGNI
ncbi:hypothetical protein KC19_3G111600 [Ceratodon purpureus]|uniref:Uncharacterized protein n=1 Tax=Ceratodon purpureus TaxID=3225 RepID=A0A8T0III7_CERPU|nr:hypothetical protein KC19_3G111000 [Ceratodon purpureus]KAG0583128.1 hypothetical protein KC19_3G111600 [Ceratodon purpureus]